MVCDQGARPGSEIAAQHAQRSMAEGWSAWGVCMHGGDVRQHGSGQRVDVLFHMRAAQSNVCLI